MDIRSQIVSFVRKSTWISYGKKKSIIKRLLPDILIDHPFTSDFYGLSYRGNAADHIDRCVFLCGAYEKHVLHFMRDAVDRSGLRRGAYIDVGANTGNHALFMSRIVNRVVALEPFEPVRLELEEKISSNAVTNIEVLPFGLGADTADMPFTEPEHGNKGTGSFNPAFRPDKGASLSLPLVRGDDFFAGRADITPVLIKIDVEGFEYSVLQGLAHTLQQHRPLVVFELSEITRGSFGDESAFNKAFPENYCYYCFDRGNKSSGAYRLRPYRFGDSLRHQDIIAMPGESRGPLTTLIKR